VFAIRHFNPPSLLRCWFVIFFGGDSIVAITTPEVMPFSIKVALARDYARAATPCGLFY
jgi:hypothetical protein